MIYKTIHYFYVIKITFLDVKLLWTCGNILSCALILQLVLRFHQVLTDWIVGVAYVWRYQCLKVCLIVKVINRRRRTLDKFQDVCIFFAFYSNNIAKKKGEIVLSEKIQKTRSELSNIGSHKLTKCVSLAIVS